MLLVLALALVWCSSGLRFLFRLGLCLGLVLVSAWSWFPLCLLWFGLGVVLVFVWSCVGLGVVLVFVRSCVGLGVVLLFVWSLSGLGLGLVLISFSLSLFLSPSFLDTFLLS